MAVSVYPKVSCLTITKNRLVLLKQAIACYCHQTYPNKELVIVAAGSKRYQAAIGYYISTLNRNDIRLVPLAEHHVPIGKMRNISLDKATGELICCWDDDDLFHPDRILLQYQALQEKNAGACFLTDFLQLYSQTRRLHWINWQLIPGIPLHQSMLPHSVLMQRSENIRYLEYDFAGEDNMFRQQVIDNMPVTTLPGKGYLYVYRVHGKNMCPESHHQTFTSSASSPASFLKDHAAQITDTLNNVPVNIPVHVMDQEHKKLYSYYSNTL